jgi:hypothetical protein
MKHYFTIFLVCITFNGFSQNIKNLQIADTSEFPRKNEIWFDVMPVFMAMATNPWDNAGFSLTYKRRIGKQWLRLAGMFNPNYIRHEYGISQMINDSTIMERMRIHNQNSAGGRLGIEYRKNWRIFTPFIAFDAVFHYARQNYDVHNAFYRVSGPPALPEIAPDRDNLIGRSDRFFTSTRESYFTGIGIGFGLILPLSHRWSIAAQGTLQAGVEKLTITNHNLMVGQPTQTRNTNILFDQRPIHELNIIFQVLNPRPCLKQKSIYSRN